MLEAYEIGISLALQDGVSTGIALVRSNLATLDRAIAATSQNLARLQTQAGQTSALPSAASVAPSPAPKHAAIAPPIQPLSPGSPPFALALRPAEQTPSYAPALAVTAAAPVPERLPNRSEPSPPLLGSSAPARQAPPATEARTTPAPPPNTAQLLPTTTARSLPEWPAPARPAPTRAVQPADLPPRPIPLAASSPPVLPVAQPIITVVQSTKPVVPTRPALQAPPLPAPSPITSNQASRPAPRTEIAAPNHPQTAHRERLQTHRPARSPKPPSPSSTPRSAQSTVPSSATVQPGFSQPNPLTQTTVAPSPARPATPTQYGQPTPRQSSQLPQPPTSFAPPPSQAQQNITLSGDVILDGARVGRWMTSTLARQAARPPAGPTGPDPRQTPLWSGQAQGF